MKAITSIPWVEAAITSFSLWTARELLGAWRHSPLERWSWLTCLIWCVPAAVTVFRSCRTTAWPTSGSGAAAACSSSVQAHPGFLAGALACAVIGGATDLNVLRQLGLALALAAWVRPARRDAFWIWLLTAVAWLPVFGWLTAGKLGPALPYARLGLVIVGTSLATIPRGRTSALVP